MSGSVLVVNRGRGEGVGIIYDVLVSCWSRGDTTAIGTLGASRGRKQSGMLWPLGLHVLCKMGNQVLKTDNSEPSDVCPSMLLASCGMVFDRTPARGVLAPHAVVASRA